MKLFRPISSILLAVLVLVSSTSFKIGVHVCGGKIQNIALFTKADDCEMERSLPPCHKHTKAPCCEDETVIHTSDDFKASVTHFHILAPLAIDIEQPLVLISEIIPSAFFSFTAHYDYDPPLRSCDRTIEHQIFLI